MLVLRSSTTSPFARKIRIAISILGLEDEIRIENADTLDPKDSVRQQNPLGKIPTLVLDDGSEVTRAKPDPESYLVTAGRLGVDPSRCVVFEDSAIGVRAAKNAGMFCIAVRNPRSQKFQDLALADVVVSSFEELDLSSRA